LKPMDRPSTDFTEDRDHMVDGQVRQNKVVDPRIIQRDRAGGSRLLAFPDTVDRSRIQGRDGGV